ncbi:MAG: calcium/sodium antiporter [Acidimicrobiales bacterium]
MLYAIAAIVVGVGVLAWAADQFVLGASRVALIRNVSPLVVGVVIIGFGTSAPELIVSAIASAGDEPEVAIGNIVGSNIANLSLLLGVGALIVPLVVVSRTVKREAPLVVGAVILFAVVVQGGGISRVEGVLLLLAMAVSLFVVSRQSSADPLDGDVVELADPAGHRFGREVGRTLVGLLGTIGAAQLLLWGALDLAERAELSEGFVGATMVAVGTSLPELVTVVQSARRRETDLIVGNLLGSNLFNALGVGGVVGLIGAPSIDNAALTTVAALAAVVVAAGALLVMMTSHTVTRREGFVLIAAYAIIVPFLA